MYHSSLYSHLSDGCDQCFLRTNLKSLTTHYSTAIKTHGAHPKDIVFILNTESTDDNNKTPDAMEASTFLKKNFPEVDIKFNDDFEGMEKSIVFNLTNGSLGGTPNIIPLSLTRANNHLVILIEDFMDILKDGVKKNVVKMSQHNLPPFLAPADVTHSMTATGLKEAFTILASQARQIPVESITRLAEQ